MASITLLCTSHNERGACTEQALLDILRDIKPEVVFLELRASDFAKHAKNMLEARAVHRLSSTQSVEPVPVDAFEIPASFHNDTEIVFDYVEAHSEHFNGLVQQRDAHAALGYAALNSSAFETLLMESESAMARTIQLSRDESLIARHAAWTSTLKKRESSMLTNIYDFCRKSPPKRGAFLVGAAHASSISKAIGSHIAREPNVVQWKQWSRPERCTSG